MGRALVFLDPDGTQDRQLHVVVESPTGVEYRSQCAGLACEERAAEGFLIPLGQAERVTGFSAFFAAGPPDARPAEPGAERAERLRQLVGRVVCWRTEAEGDHRERLALDEERLDECVEAWVPVRTPYGPGILVFPNSD